MYICLGHVLLFDILFDCESKLNSICYFKKCARSSILLYYSILTNVISYFRFGSLIVIVIHVSVTVDIWVTVTESN